MGDLLAYIISIAPWMAVAAVALAGVWRMETLAIRRGHALRVMGLRMSVPELRSEPEPKDADAAAWLARVIPRLIASGKMISEAVEDQGEERQRQAAIADGLATGVLRSPQEAAKVTDWREVAESVRWMRADFMYRVGAGPHPGPIPGFVPRDLSLRSYADAWERGYVE